jgi:hypothetical protein
MEADGVAFAAAAPDSRLADTLGLSEGEEARIAVLPPATRCATTTVRKTAHAKTAAPNIHVRN